MAYLKPIRIAYKGDKTVAARYVRDARRLAQNVIETLGRATSGRRTFQLPNKAGSITIIVAGPDNVTAIIKVGGGRKKARWFEDFVADAGVNAYEGNTLVYYQLIFQPNQDEKKPGWRTYFRNTKAPGYKIAPEPKGTYADVFYRKDPGPYMGDMHLPGGNRNHRNPDGEYVSWRGFGAYNYFYPPYRTTWNSAGFWVWHQGHMLLNTIELYQTHDDGKGAFHVLGAALRDGYLYTIQGGLQINLSYPTAPNPAPRRAVWASPLFHTGGVYISCRRYKVYPFRDEQSGAVYYKLSKDAPEILWEGNVPRGQNYWNFDEGCTVAVTYELPEKHLALFNEGELTTTELTTNSLRYRIEIDHEAGTAAAFQSPAGTAVAEEDGNVLHLVPEADGHYFVTPWWTLPAMSYGYDGFKSTRLTFLDMKNGWAAGMFYREEFINSGTTLDGEIIWRVQTRSDAFVINPKGEQTILGSQNGRDYWMFDLERSERVVAMDKVMALGPSSMTKMYMQVAGCFYDVYVPDPSDPNEPPLEDRAMYFVYNPLYMFQFADTNNGGTFGGLKISTAGAERDDNWGQWQATFGNGPGDSPDPFPIQYPEVFVLTGSGAGTENNALFGVRFIHNPPYVFYTTPPPPGPVEVSKVFNYITNGDLELLSGGNFNDSTRYALSVSILGAPPLAQTLFY